MAAFDKVRPRMKASGAISISVGLQRALDDARIHQVVERVVDRPQIGIDLFAHVAGQKAEPLAGFDRRPRQHDAIDFLALEQLHGMGHREPGLAGAGGSGREHQRMALERADIGVLRGGAGADAALAQIDLFETLARGGGIEIEQRALRQREPDSAVDVALHQFVAALESLVKALEHAARLIAGFARAFERDVIAARIGDDAEPALDQREVLAVLPEQHGGEPVVVEGQNDLGRIVRRDEDRLFGSGGTGCSQFRLLRRRESACCGLLRGVCAECAEQTVAADLGDRHRGDFADQRCRRCDLHRLQIGRAADQLAGMAAGRLEQHIEAAAEAAAVERRLAAVDRSLQALQALRLYVLVDLIVHVGAGRAGPRRIFERERAGEADLARSAPAWRRNRLPSRPESRR